MKFDVKCEQCQAKMVVAEATSKTPYRYIGSGLDNVWLVGIKVLNCPRCDVKAPVIPRIEELHRTIAAALLKKPAPLRGDEIRFLRKHAEFPAQDFAALLGITPSHLSRIENGKTPKLGRAADRLARMIAKAHLSGSFDLEALKQLAGEKLSASSEKATGQIELFLKRNHWQAEPKAA